MDLLALPGDPDTVSAEHTSIAAGRLVGQTSLLVYLNDNSALNKLINNRCPWRNYLEPCGG
jgi:hypothetical protein